MFRALSYLDTEMLPAVRLTCKTLDSIVFDRFAETHFAHIYCCVSKPAAFHRLKDILQNSQVLRARIKHVTLTDNPFEDLPPSALHVVRGSNQPVDDNYERVFMGYILQQESGTMTGAGLILMQRALRDLKDLPQGVSVDVDLMRNGWFREQHEHGFQSTIIALAISQTTVSSLAFDYRSLEHIDDVLVHGRADLLASMSTITSLTYIGDFWLYPRRPNLAVCIEILRSMTRLRHLTFATYPPSDDGDYVGRYLYILRVPQEIWAAIDFSHLASLDLSHTVLNITEQDFSRLMAQCRSTLTHVKLRRVALWTSDEAWKLVGEALLTMPELVFVELQMIRTSNDITSIWSEQVTTFRDGDPPGVRLEGSDNVVKGLQKLAYLGTSFFQQLRNEELEA